MTLRSLTPTIIKITAFTAVIGVLTYVIIAILQPTNEGSSSSQRSAVFADASGLKPPATGVRLAGVKVGYVTAVDLKGSTAIVRFQLDDGVSITPPRRLPPSVTKTCWGSGMWSSSMPDKAPTRSRSHRCTQQDRPVVRRIDTIQQFQTSIRYIEYGRDQ